MTEEMDMPTRTLIEEHVRQLLQTMGFSEVQVQCSNRSKTENNPLQALQINIEAGDDGKLLIGAHGAHLAALQHVVRTIVRRQLAADMLIAIDVNGYRIKREQNLAHLAEGAAKRAKTQGRTIVLRPMGAHDRRMIHTALSEREDITTESMGDEPNRRVVVKPVFM